MQTESTKKLFTVAEFHKMAEAEIFVPGERVELINGEIVEMSPISDRHMSCVDRANTLLVPATLGRAIVSIQNSVVLNIRSAPQPDVLVLKPAEDFYASRRRNAGDVLLLIEVSHSTLRYDQTVKLPLYASSGIGEYWIEDLENDQLFVHRDPAGDVYKTCRTLRSGDSVSPLAFPDLVFDIDDLLG